MKMLLLSLAIVCLMFLTAGAAAPDSRCFEMRTYHAAEGKLEDLHNRFRNHTNKLFEKHGINMLGYWVELDKDGKPANKLIFVLSYPNKEARERSWKAFAADPAWQKAKKDSEANGTLVEKVDQVFMTPTDYSPAIKPSSSARPRTFELRVYTTPPDRLDDLHARFRDHTVGLFSKHGMQHIAYWTPMKGEKGADNTLIYILAHKSREAAAESFKTFRADPNWISARKASEEKAGGSLTVPDGVKSTFMTPTDYSPTK